MNRTGRLVSAGAAAMVTIAAASAATERWEVSETEIHGPAAGNPYTEVTFGATLQPDRVHELIERVKACQRDGRRLLAGTSYGGGTVPKDNVVRVSDFLLPHGNGAHQPDRIRKMVDDTRALPTYRGQPILFNEDDHFDFDKPGNNMLAAVSRYASWGYFDFRMKGEGFDEGFQSVPVNWSISSARKRGFFELLSRMTAPPAPPKTAEPSPAGQPASGALAGERFRVLVSTDIGGSDPDDFQSMVHYLVYADLFFAKKKDIKMGDTPSVLYLLRGRAEDPGGDHWGGAFVRRDTGPNHWTDNPGPAFQEKNHPGARTVNRWREAYLRDWQRRMDALQPWVCGRSSLL